MVLQISQKQVPLSFGKRNVILENSVRKVTNPDYLFDDLKKIADQEKVKIKVSGFRTFSLSNLSVGGGLKALISEQSEKAFKHCEKVVIKAKEGLTMGHLDKFNKMVKGSIKILRGWTWLIEVY